MNISINKICIFSLILIILFISGCQQQKDPNKIVMWTGMYTDNELKMLREMGTEFEKLKGVKVEVIEIPFSDLQNKFQIAAPAGQGPDLVTGPQDWVGIFAAANLISPLDEYINNDEKNTFMPMSIESASYNNKLFAIPLSMEAMALIYNKDMIPSPPATMEALFDEAKKRTIINEKTKIYEQYGFLIEINNFYPAFPLFSGRGAYVFDKLPDGSLDPMHLGLNNEGAKEAAKILYDLKDFGKYGLIPEGIAGDKVLGLFTEKKAAMIVNGPWVINEFDKAGLNYGVAPLPPFQDGSVPKPFVGILGIMLNRFAANPDKAKDFMLFMKDKNNQLKIYRALRRIPATIEALNSEEVKGDEKIQGFYQSAQNGVALPNLPVMSSVWAPMIDAMTLITSNPSDNPDKLIETNLNKAVQRIENNIKRLLR